MQLGIRSKDKGSHFSVLLQGFKRYWCRLHRETDLHPQQLVLYETSQNDDENFGKAAHFIPLDDVFKVTTEDEKCQFNILTCSKKYSVRIISLQETNAWVEAINKEVFGPPLPGIICRFLLCTYILTSHTHTHIYTHICTYTNTHTYTQTHRVANCTSNSISSALWHYD